jgi:riboflavin synthase
MFTGIVTELGTVEASEGGRGGARLRVSAELVHELRPGDSVAVCGACLTAAAVNGRAFEADVMDQTLSLTTLGELRPGDKVNLELPLRAADRLGGHMVQGHVDGIGQVADISEEGNARRLRVELPQELLPLVVEHGSVALAGVSLTVAGLGEDWIEVSLIPESLKRTTLGGLEVGDRLNVECDVVARYAQRLLAGVSPLGRAEE